MVDHEDFGQEQKEIFLLIGSDIGKNKLKTPVRPKTICGSLVDAGLQAYRKAMKLLMNFKPYER